MSAADNAYDPRLTPAARRYVASRSSGDARRDAIDAAIMDGQEFQSRYGPVVDGMEAKIDAIYAMLRANPVVGGGPLTRTAQWLEATPMRRSTTLVGVLSALAASMSALAGQVSDIVQLLR
jgi:hypothetical protein